MDKPRLSVVIPYHTHPDTLHFLKRQLSFYCSQKFPIAIILALSGDRDIINNLEEYIKHLNSSRILLFATDESDITNVRSFIKKIYDALKMVKTPYVTINGADDLLILTEIEKGIQLLDSNPDLAAAKGHTVYYNCNLGTFFNSQDPEIEDNCPYSRLKAVMKHCDSIFYILRRTKDLVKEYKNLVYVIENSRIVASSLYHVEHVAALSLVSAGKLSIYSSPWRIQSSHENNHTSHTPAFFIRFKLGPLEKGNYLWFQSVTPNMKQLGYARYRFLWVCHQIRGIHVTLKQIVYNFLHKKCNLREFVCILAYYSLNKVSILIQKIMLDSKVGEKQILYGNTKDFVDSKYYEDLKKHYFTENDIQLIESNIK